MLETETLKDTPWSVCVFTICLIPTQAAPDRVNCYRSLLINCQKIILTNEAVQVLTGNTSK